MNPEKRSSYTGVFCSRSGAGKQKQHELTYMRGRGVPLHV